MNLLCIDIGNTSTSFCVYSCNEFGDIHRIINDDDTLNYITSYDFQGFKSVIISSVAPSKLNKIEKILIKRKIDYFIVTHKNCCIELIVDIPWEVGADRICNIAAAKAKKIYPSIIIDFGTATTYDVVNELGQFVGGAIAPGIDVSANHLINKTELLRETVYKYPNSVIGKNTSTNIQAGVMFSGLKSVEGMIHLILEEMGATNMHITLTGGFGRLISKKLIIKHEYNEKLTFIGMIYIYKNNYQQKAIKWNI